MATTNFIVQDGLTVGGEVVPTSSNVYALGSTTNWWSKVHSIAATAQYADLAENYVADAEYHPGTVLDFGGVNEVTLSSVDGSKRVAGVVSTNPAYLMNAMQPGQFIASIALQGRVPTHVVGPVAKGDLMVSNGQGRARSEENPLPGTIIGKALEDFAGDVGTIEVVIGKH